VDLLLTAKRDRKAALRFLRRAINQNCTLEKITMDKSGANTAAIESHNAEHEAGIEIRQVKYGLPMRRLEKSSWLWQLAHDTTNVGRLRGDGDDQEGAAS
jgi:transposase-like protein